MSNNYWHNNILSKDDMNVSRYNQQNSGVSSTGRLNTVNGFNTNLNNNNIATGFNTGNSLPRQLDKVQIEKVYKTGTHGINQFERNFFKEAGNDQKLIFASISALDRFTGFQSEELRYIDWKIKKNNPIKFKDTPEFNRVNSMGNYDAPAYNSTTTGGLGNFSVSKNNMGLNLINSNNVSTNGNNDFNSYLRPNSAQGINANNKTFPISNTLQSNSLNNTSTSINNFPSANPIGAFNKNQFGMSTTNYVSNGGTPSNAIINNNKSFANYYDNSNIHVFPVTTAINPVVESSGFNSINNNFKNFQSANISGTNSTANSFNNHITPNQIPVTNQNPFGSTNNSTAFNTNNNYISSTSNNIHFGISSGANITPQNKFNTPFNQTMPMTNNSINNQNNSSMPFATANKFNPQNLSSNNNLNFSTPSQSSINIQAGGNANNFQNRPQDIQFGISNNTLGMNQSNFGFGNNQGTLNFKSSTNSGNNITFNNSYTTNINQTKSLNSICEVLHTINSNDDYLGIKSLCQEVNTNLNKFNKKEIEELFDMPSNDEKSSSYFSGINHRNNYSTTSKLNKNYFDSTARENNSSRNFTSFNDNLPHKNSSMMTLANNRNNKENSYSNLNSNMRNHLGSIDKPIDRHVSIQNEMRERSSSKDSGFKFNDTSFRRPFETAKKALTIQDILPLNNNKRIIETNLIDKVDILEERANNGLNIFRTNIKPENMIKTQAEMNNSNTNYYKSTEYRNEILKMAEEVHRKCVGGPSSSESDQKFRNVIPAENKNLFPNKNNFSTEKKLFSKTNNQLQTFFKSNKNMNTIYESSQEADINLYDIKEIDNLDNSPHKKQENNSAFNLEGILNLKFKISIPVLANFNIKINKKNKVVDLRNAIDELLREKFPSDFVNLCPAQVIILSKNGILIDDDIIEAKSFVNEKELLNVFIANHKPLEDDDSQYKFSHKENINLMNEGGFDREDVISITNGLGGFMNQPSENTRDIEIKFLKENIRPEYCPFTKKYQTDPSYVELTKMPKEKLMNLKNFSISNQHGKIVWKQSIDVTYLNFDEIVEISKLYIDVYPDMNSPKFGEKLNVGARLHIYNLECPEEAKESDDKFREFIINIKKSLEKRNGQFIDYDVEKSELIFDVRSFDRKLCI